MDTAGFGGLLREARQRALLTLESLAAASGVSARAISDMERGQSLPRQATLSELLDALELDEGERRRLAEAATRRRRQNSGRVPRQLPPDLAVFRGRTAALAAAHELTAQVTEPGGHVVVAAVGGMAGVGKTTLAVHWAHQVADRFPDGQLYVNLRGFEDAGHPMDPAEALSGFLTALGVADADLPRATEDRSALFRELAASRRLIIVLDNARDEEQVRPLLPASTRCLTVVTSRSQLVGLVAMEGARPVALDVWTRKEALSALAARIGEERVRAEPEAAVALVELCGHLALAVAIVAAQLSATPGLSLRTAVRELRGTGPLLDALSADARRGDVRVVFSWSYRALPPDTAAFFRHLALHPGPSASAEAAASLAGVSVREARRHLRQLTAANLLARDAEGRHVLHDLVRAYGVELAEREKDDGLGARVRLFDYLCHNAYTANRLLGEAVNREVVSPGQAVVRVALDTREEVLDWFRQEQGTAASALHSMGDEPRLLRIGMTLSREWVSYYSVRGRWNEEIQTARIGLDAALRLDEPAVIVFNAADLARPLAQKGELDEADRHVELMLAQLHRLGPSERAFTERNVGWVRGRQKRYDEALHHAGRALEMYRALGEERAMAREMNAVGWYLALLGRYEETITLCTEAIPLLQRDANPRIEAAAWDTMGYARQRLGDLDGAASNYRESLRVYAEAFDNHNQAEVLDHLATAQREQGDDTAARASWLRAADLLSEIDDPRAAHMRAKAEALDTSGESPESR
ncbi:helix-turn-helix domain-containing protein [Streptomyces sp. VRA16 Mangrove soil]|uniref:helix-turn-helix domain-containing protein n=1 Tax=Streptomyces sp. VRA16 Mangrove soil TaxID=2817434 RepID=UPI001A9E8774|nr:helix-turn-helix domain-containing protein [Streptomyces sp. VRA16 Mangrove soil]MBO1329863.1 helix-turn-helix domain-containing protein [Streptomyces sp. VRA16 Mangrove soil]